MDILRLLTLSRRIVLACIMLSCSSYATDSYEERESSFYLLTQGTSIPDFDCCTYQELCELKEKILMDLERARQLESIYALDIITVLNARLHIVNKMLACYPYGESKGSLMQLLILVGTIAGAYLFGYYYMAGDA